jgi:DHA3 family macrolide efflux protein-like MFS transporter
MITADALTAFFTLALAYLFWIDLVIPWHIYGLMFLRSLFGTIHMPTFIASTSLMVPKTQLTRVAGMNQILVGSSEIVAPPLGALLLSLLAVEKIILIDLATAALAIASLLFVAVPRPSSRVHAGRRSSFFIDLRDGFRFVWLWRGLSLMLLTSAMARFLVLPGYHFIPLLVTKHFGGGALQLGWITSVEGIGTVAGGFILSLWGGFRRRMLTTMLGVCGIGLGFLTMGLAPASAFWLALGGMAIAGLCIPIMNGSRTAILQSAVPPEMQGRVLTLYSSLMQAMIPLGLIIGGPVADVIGVRAMLIIAGCVCLAVVVFYALTPVILYLEDYKADSSGDDASASPP